MALYHVAEARDSRRPRGHATFLKIVPPCMPVGSGVKHVPPGIRQSWAAAVPARFVQTGRHRRLYR
jgi:hypothetical protein